jgi:hypothetical protein
MTMGLFTRPSIKQLRDEAEQIGRLHGMQHLGRISQDDLDSVIDSEHFRSKLREAYDAAYADVGETKALKEAVKTARMFAEIVADVGGSRFHGHVPSAAERSVRLMLGLLY